MENQNNSKNEQAAFERILLMKIGKTKFKVLPNTEDKKIINYLII